MPSPYVEREFARLYGSDMEPPKCDAGCMSSSSKWRQMLTKLAAQTREFDAECEQAQYTDTGKAWLLLWAFAAAVEALDRAD